MNEYVRSISHHDLSEWVEATLTVQISSPLHHLHFQAALRTHQSRTSSWISAHFGLNNLKNDGNHDKKRSFLLFCFLRCASGDQNVHYSDNNRASEAA